MINGKRLFNNLGDIIRADSKNLGNSRLNLIYKRMMDQNQDVRISARDCILALTELRKGGALEYKTVNYPNGGSISGRVKGW